MFTYRSLSLSSPLPFKDHVLLLDYKLYRSYGKRCCACYPSKPFGRAGTPSRANESVRAERHGQYGQGLRRGFETLGSGAPNTSSTCCRQRSRRSRASSRTWLNPVRRCRLFSGTARRFPKPKPCAAWTRLRTTRNSRCLWKALPCSRVSVLRGGFRTHVLVRKNWSLP
jgi:hypothetical protein